MTRQHGVSVYTHGQGNSVAAKLRSNLRRSQTVLLSSFMAGSLLGGPAMAQHTLKDALVAAYRSNPALLAQRRGVEATDETVSQARAGFRPKVIGTADTSHVETRTDPGSLGDGSTRPRGYTIQFTQSVFEGFRTVNAVRRAEANVLAAREQLRAAEQDILLSGVTAYMDVLRDRAVVRLQENLLRVLTRTLRATRDRLSAGDATRTDVAQAEARRAGAVSALDTAKANLRSSRADFEQIMGYSPGRLREPAPPNRKIPSTLDEAKRMAIEENPNVVNAAFVERAAQHNIDQLTGQLLPTVSIEADYTNRFDQSAFINQRETATVMGRLTVPFYQGGGVYSQIRQARRTREQLAQEIENQRRIARNNIVTTWSAWRAAIARLRSDRVQVKANQIALSGVRTEEDVGQRSLLDILDAEQELLDAQVTLSTTKRDLVVAGYSVIAAIGRLTSTDLDLQVEPHDPEVHYGAVHRKAWGTRAVPEEEYAGVGVNGWEAEVRSSSNLLEDVARMAHEASGWAVSEIRRENDVGEWGGRVITAIDADPESYK